MKVKRKRSKRAPRLSSAVLADTKSSVKKSSPKKEKKMIRDNERQIKHVRKLQLLEANVDEDKEISKLEKALKLKKRRKVKTQTSQKPKIPLSFVDDGLDYLLDVVDKKDGEFVDSDFSNEGDESVEPKKSVLSQRKNEKGCQRPHVGAKKPRKLVDLLDAAGKMKITHDSDNELSEPVTDSEMGENYSDISNEHSDDSNDLDEEHVQSDDDSDDHDVSEKKKGQAELWEDIYGRVRDKEGNVIKTDSGAYIPPAKRMKMGEMNEQKKDELSRIKRQLKGLLNRLSEANLKPIATQIEQMYMKYSRNDMNETLISLMMEMVIGPIPTPPRLIMDQAMIVALLHANIGSEVGAFFLQSCACKLDELVRSGENYGPGKQCNNLLSFLSHLYNYKVTHCTLMLDILEVFVASFKDKDIELIQLLLKSIGFSLRKDNPLKLKEVIHSIQTKAPSFQSKEDGSRVQFMLDTLTAIRNNNMYKIPDYDPSIVEHSKKLLRGFVRPGASVQELVISYEDLLKSEERGRWWIIGSAWSERETPGTSGSSNATSVLPKSEVSEKILELAKTQRMNTEIRRTIFCIIMTAEDFMDAFEKLLKLNLKSQQEREIINVLLHCVISEKNYNPYYTYLAGKFCKFARKYHMNLQFALWDKFKELENLKAYQINSMAQFLIHLFTTGDMPISILKVIQFSEMNKCMVRFFRKILHGILLHDSEEVCCNVFLRIAPAKNLSVLREGLRLFMHHFLLRDKGKLDASTAEKLTQRIESAEAALNSAKRAFKLW